MQLCNTILIVSEQISVIISWNTQDQHDNRLIELLEHKLAVALLASALQHTCCMYKVIQQARL